ncbi:Methyl viologen resistance protein SmvA [Tepidimonas sediminis]|uniref:Methyl viologen resistance protein SmvA n=1 Tax=Tepidimonas sediminis TaxID=2588941 RepID=A0A554WPY5_9BURK|nr:MFS transporter [Tepidimonas sediminis]TSE25652.1 Methyl viologen resistance protein SmvA [Tepidimonas sediminis]
MGTMLGIPPAALPIVLVGVASAMHVGKLPPALPLLARELGVTLVQGGFLLSMIQLAGMTLGALAGQLADRLGPRRVMLGGLVLLAAGSLAGALAPAAAWLLAARALEGVGFLMTVLPAPGLIRRGVTEPGPQARALGWWGAYMPIGAALGLALTPPLYATLGWRTAWGALALLALACAGLVARRVPADGASPAGGTAALRAALQGLRTTLAAAGPWLVALAFGVYSGQWLAVVGFLPTIYTEAGWPGAVVGWASALAAGVNLAGNVLAGRLLARGWPVRRLLWLGYGAMAAGALGTFTAPPLAAYGAVLAFSALGGLVPGTLFALAVRLAPSPATVSTTVGWVQQLSSLGQFAAPPLVAALAARVGGWQWTWLFNVACCAAGALLAVALQARWRRAAAVPVRV